MATALTIQVVDLLLVQRALQRREQYVELSGGPKEAPCLFEVQDVVLASHNKSNPPAHGDAL